MINVITTPAIAIPQEVKVDSQRGSKFSTSLRAWNSYNWC